MNYQQFKDRWKGGRYRETEKLGYQCVALAKIYIVEVWNFTPSQIFTVDLNFKGGAKDAFYDFPRSLVNYNPNVILINNILDDLNNYPLQGDIIIFSGKMGGGYGHIGIVDEANGYRVKVLDQNAVQGDGDGLNGDEISIHTYSYKNVLGWLRYLPQNSIKHNNNQEEQPMSATEKMEVSKQAVSQFFSVLRDKKLPVNEKDLGTVQGLIDKNALQEASNHLGDYLLWSYNPFKNQINELEARGQTLMTSLEFVQKNQDELNTRLNQTLLENTSLNNELKEQKEKYDKLLKEKEDHNRYPPKLIPNDKETTDKTPNLSIKIKNIISQTFQWWNSKSSNKPIIITSIITSILQFLSTNSFDTLNNLTNQYLTGQTDSISLFFGVLSVLGFNTLPSSLTAYLSFTGNDIKNNNLIKFINSFNKKQK